MLGRSQHLTDCQLLSQAKRGVDSAFEELFRRYWSMAVRIARTSLHDEDSAREAASEAFVRVIAAIKAGKGPDEHFGGYLVASVKNVAVRMAQRASRSELHAGPEPSATRQHAPSAGPATLLEETFRQLRPQWREALWLTEVEGWTAQELAVRLGTTANSVAALCYRARSALRSAYFEAYRSAAERPACHVVAPLLPLHGGGSLVPHVHYQVEVHINHCRACQRAVSGHAWLEEDTRAGALGEATGGAPLSLRAR
jgi:RNA polymerase sigma factor (sigma-70 family)